MFRLALRSITYWWGVLAIVTFFIKKKSVSAGRSVDIRLLALVTMLVLRCMSIEFELESNADFAMHQ